MFFFGQEKTIFRKGLKAEVVSFLVGFGLSEMTGFRVLGIVSFAKPAMHIASEQQTDGSVTTTGRSDDVQKRSPGKQVAPGDTIRDLFGVVKRWPFKGFFKTSN